MISNQQLYEIIPKQVRDWNEQQVAKWFEINDIQIKTDFKLNGQQLLKLTPQMMVYKMGLSNFLVRKLAEWIQFEASDFDEYINEIKQEEAQAENYQPNLKSNKSDKSETKKKDSDNSEIQDICVNLNFDYRSAPLIDIQQSEIKNSSILIQNESTEIYNPQKYKHQNSASKKQKQNNDLHKVNDIIQKKFVKKNDKRNIAVKESAPSSNLDKQEYEQIQTQKHIPAQSSEYFNDVKVHPSVHNSPIQKQSNFFSKNVKFVSSHLQIPVCRLLVVCYAQDRYLIQKKVTKIGRSINNNDIVLKSDGVSRNHAQIIMCEEVNEKFKTRKYYLKDIGSKFGTFLEVDPERPKKIEENQCFCLGSTNLRIEKFKIYKNKDKFDISIVIINQEQELKNFYSRTQIGIGKKKKDHNTKQYKSSQQTKRYKQKQKLSQSKDLEIEDPQLKNQHCRFVIINNQLYLQQVQGNILEKIEKDQSILLERKLYQAKFGDQSVTFSFQNQYKSLSDDS